MSEQNDRSPELWSGIDDLCAWVEAGQPVGGREGLLLGLLKLSEEVGEVSEAVIGATGQNQRKGVTHTWDDVQAELCDVVITALVALRMLTPDTQEVFTRHLARVLERSLGPSAGVHPQDLPTPRGVGEVR
ncbi:MazG-like family protein [Streptomyces sp. N50]|uniref:MazG-like family protein n=1 Tax=Streptomyces sp. N50 TaxID=3081765 RepID=UPI0029622689|nr:MazG-like family protein [Streptomyces sp. N50]WOX09281.1 MazG-like family protein [Streptomyces sp. N50]